MSRARHRPDSDVGLATHPDDAWDADHDDWGREPRTGRVTNRPMGETGRRLSGVSHRLEDYLGDSGQSWVAEQAGVPPVIEYTDVVDEEEIWGPRPKLLAAENGGRRTVVITGQAAGRAVGRTSGHTSALDHARHFSPDRTAMWAVLLCVIVLLVAITSH